MEEKVVHTTVAGVSYQCEVIARRKFTMIQQLSCQSCSPITAQLPLLTLQVLLPLPCCLLSLPPLPLPLTLNLHLLSLVISERKVVTRQSQIMKAVLELRV
jgi:hypothetical protein